MKVISAILVLLTTTLEGVRRISPARSIEGTQAPNADRVTVVSDAGEAEFAPEIGTKAIALTTVLTRLGKEEMRLFASVALEMPDATMFVACTTDLVESFKSPDMPTLTYRLAPILDKFEGLNRTGMTNKLLWVEFNEKRIDILKLALREGHNGAWYMDGDTFLLAPLPQIEALVGLSRHRIAPSMEDAYGEWNSGYLFFRSFDALATWERASQALVSSAGVHQITLREVAKKYSNDMVDLGCGINVGGFRMDPEISEDFQPYYDQVQCKDGAVQFRDCPLVSGHWHLGDKNGLAVRPYMESALRECGHPLLEIWLNSY